MARKWTPEEEETAKDALLCGLTWEQISEKLEEQHGVSRSPKAIKTHLTWHPKQSDSAEKELLKQNELLRRQLVQLLPRQQYCLSIYSGEVIRFGVVSDTHMASLYENQNLLEHSYDLFEQEGISKVFHAGDMCDGEKMHRGQEYEIHKHGSDAQVAYCIENYPCRDSIETKFITGSHDLSFFKRSGTDIGERIAEKREDMEYLGPEEANVKLESPEGEATLRIIHPMGGTAYALSYHPQRYIERIPGGEKPNIIICGHYHKSEHLPNYRNVEFFQAGCIEYQTRWMRSHCPAIMAMMGFWIIELVLDGKGISRCKGEFFPCYQ